MHIIILQFDKIMMVVVSGIYLRIEGNASCKRFEQYREIGNEKYLDEKITCFDGTRGKTK